MTEPVFVDTNVLVYRHDSSDRGKQSRADQWIRLLVQRRSARTSFQVLQELYVTLTRKLKPGFDVGEAQEIVRDLSVWRPVAIDLAVMDRSWLLQQHYSLSWWDSLIVAAAHVCECPVLLTEDLQHDQFFGEVRTINPFSSPRLSPRQILDG